MIRCPTEPELRAFLSGAVSAVDQETLSGHIDSCADCLRLLGEFDSNIDPLVGALRGAACDQTPLEPAVQRLLDEGTPLQVGGRIGPYVLLEKLGEGGMGAVFKVRHERLGKVFALKLLPSGWHLDRERAARFEREMKAVGRLEHPHIVRATDAGEHDGMPFLALELVLGTDLARFVRFCGPLRPADACEVVRQAALGLQHAHDRGLVHRDVKPSNLLLTPDGTVKLLDLGLALAADEPVSAASAAGPAAAKLPPADLTATGFALGTRDYMAPEQAANPHGVDARADVYGLGATLHFLLTAHPPALGGSIPGGLSGVLARMLEPDPSARLGSANEVAAVLARRVRGHDLAALAAGRRPRSGRRWAVAAAAAGILVMGGLAVAASLSGGTGASELATAAAAAPVPAQVPAVAPPLPVPVPPVPAPLPGENPMTAPAAQELQRRWADYLKQPLVERGPAGIKTVLIPPGTLQMYPRYVASITKPYRLGTTEVTRGQFRAFVAARRYITTGELATPFKPLGVVIGADNDHGNWHDPGFRGDDDHPVTHVSHMDAEAFVAWLSETEGKTYRLPTEAEWRWACRAGATTRYPWGDNPVRLSEYAVFNVLGKADPKDPTNPSSVATRRPNVWGLHDMLGNVREWSADGLITFREGVFADPLIGPQPDGMRVACGGSYSGRTNVPDSLWWNGGTCDCNTRMGRHYYISSREQGFRVCREP